MKGHAQRFACNFGSHAWTAASRSNVDFRTVARLSVLLADLGKHVVECGRMPERSEGDRLSRKLGAIG
jgi:hypothetical protein